MVRRTAVWFSIVVLFACGQSTSDVPTVLDTPAPRVHVARADTSQAEQAPADARPLFAGFIGGDETLAARVRGETPVFDDVLAADPRQTVPAETILGTPTVLAVVGEETSGRIEVLVPGRPNGATGFVDVSAVDLFVVEGLIEIDLSERTLTYTVDGIEVLSSTVAVGRPAYPTPTGSFFVTDTVKLASASSPWGPYALGLSARSDTITEYNGGDGIIGIHGTNTPSSIGKAASLGCVRLPNDLITALYQMVSLGTPVEITA